MKIKRITALLLSFLLILTIGLSTITTIKAQDDVNNNSDIERYSVVILDGSSSMAGVPYENQKKAAKKFCESVLAASGDNKVAIVKITSSSSQVCGFTANLSELNGAIDSINAISGTNIENALEVSKKLLDTVKDGKDIIKNIVLCSDGLPEHGNRSYSGKYSWSDDSYCYSFANSVYTTAKTIIESGIYIYSLGFFHSLKGSRLEFAKTFMNDIQNAGNYIVTDPEKLEFTFGQIANDVTNKLKKISFTYAADGGDANATCYYTDDYFKNSSYDYNASMATMSLSLAMSAFGSNDGGSDYTNKSKNAVDLMKQIGINEDEIKTNDWFTEKPTTDSIGVVAGNKKISVDGKDVTLIALAVRGGGYEKEWASNFTLGKTGQHEGFNTAKDNVISFLKGYVTDQKITGPVKIWVTGYSRAAATSNLVGGALDSGTKISDSITYDTSDIFTYCFETPAGAMADEVNDNTTYNNIFNIINSSDPVPYVAPASLGFGRYGIDKYLPSKDSTSNYDDMCKEMLKVYNTLSIAASKKYVVDDFQMKKLQLKNWLPGGEKISIVQNDNKSAMPQSTFLRNYVTFLARDIVGSRELYVDELQAEIRQVCSVMFGVTTEQKDTLVNYMVDKFKNNWGKLILNYVWNTGINPWGTEDDALQMISDWLVEGVKEAGITSYDEKTLDSAGKNISDLLLALASNHPNYLTTAIYNVAGIGQAHYPELCYSWVSSMDPNYSSSNVVGFNNGGCRVIRINCAVDVIVKNKNGEVVSQIINEEPQESNSIVSLVNENDQKEVILPNDDEYTIEIKAREDDSVNIGISEYCAKKGDYTRNINYFDINMKAGELLTAKLPKYSSTELENDTPNGSAVQYSLLDTNGSNIEPQSDLKGTNSLNAVNYIKVASINDEYGIVTGGGSFSYGEAAKVEATPADNYRFIGWYIGDECISSDAEYKFIVKENMDIQARFDKDDNTTNTVVPSTTPNTGDSNSFGLYLLMLLLCGGILSLFVNYIRNSKAYTNN